MILLRFAHSLILSPLPRYFSAAVLVRRTNEAMLTISRVRFRQRGLVSAVTLLFSHYFIMYLTGHDALAERCMTGQSSKSG